MKWKFLLSTLLILLVSSCTGNGLDSRESANGLGQNTNSAVLASQVALSDSQPTTALCSHCPNHPGLQGNASAEPRLSCPRTLVEQGEQPQTTPCSDCPKVTGKVCEKALNGQCPKTSECPCPGSDMPQCPGRPSQG